MKTKKDDAVERVKRLEHQLNNRPSNCKHCKLKVENGESEYICARTERQTFFGTKAERCVGDCTAYEKGMPELCRDVFLSALKRAITDRKVDVPKCETMENLQSWMNGYSQCHRDILKIIDNLTDKENNPCSR